MKILACASRLHFFANGLPAIGHLVYTYKAGTTELLAVYQDKEGTTPHTNPIVLDSTASVKFFMNDEAYKIQLRTPLGVIVYTDDDIEALPADSIGTDKLQNGAVTSEKIGEGEVNSANIADGAVGTTALENDSVTEAKLADNSVGVANLKQFAVTDEKIASGAVTATKLATSAVEEDAIKPLAVTTGKIAGGAITLLKMALRNLTPSAFVSGSTSSTSWTTIATVDFVATVGDNIRAVEFAVFPSIVGTSIHATPVSDGTAILAFRVIVGTTVLGEFEFAGASSKIPLTVVRGLVSGWGVFAQGSTTSVKLEARSSVGGKTGSWGFGNFAVWQS